jgi:hypothetical protein
MAKDLLDGPDVISVRCGMGLVLCFISMATYYSGESTTATPFETAFEASSGRTES